MFTHYFIENPLEWEKRSYLQPEMFSIHFRKEKTWEREHERDGKGEERYKKRHDKERDREGRKIRRERKLLDLSFFLNIFRRQMS